MSGSNSNTRIALALAAIAVGMVMLAFASVPLYRIFCQVTGYGGTTSIADSLPKAFSDQKITVRFEATTDRNLPWEFKPNQREVVVHIGEAKLISYYAENHADHDVSGIATYNVTPFAAGRYFNKVQCFCFDKQTLNAHQKVQMPVSFFIDPAILNDKDLIGITNITLSYTFFNVESANSY
jgi:cytochrome c oxidase assembly protein subunit 11